MGLDYLTLDIQYNLKRDEFKTEGNIKEEKQKDIVECFVEGQIGKEKDPEKMIKKDIYNICLKWYPEDDNITAEYDTGNKGLRDGILLRFLGK